MHPPVTAPGNSNQEAGNRADDSRGHNQDNPYQWTVFSSMNHREPPHPSAAVRKALMCLATLLLVTAVTPHRVNAIPRLPVFTYTARVAETTPYLTINGAPPLRFTEAPAAPKSGDPLAPISSSPTSTSTESPGSSSSTNSSPVAGTSSSQRPGRKIARTHSDGRSAADRASRGFSSLLSDSKFSAETRRRDLARPRNPNTTGSRNAATQLRHLHANA